MLKRLGSLWNKNKIRKKLIIYFALTTVLLGVANVYSYYGISMFMSQVNSTFDGNVRLNKLQNTVYEVKQSLENYLATKHSQSLDDYYRCSEDLKQNSASLSIKYLNTENTLLLMDIKNMVRSLLEESDSAVTARRGRDNEYKLYYQQSLNICSYITEYIEKLNNTLLMQNTNQYLSVTDSFKIVELLNITLILAVIVFDILLIVWFIYRITRPITDLSRAADEITHGNFNVPSVHVDSNDEMGVMADAFNRMTESIRQSISDIREKAELESKLNEQEMENLVMKSKMKEAELQALQAQINPHFLFNTLNTGAQLSMLEGADKACDFLENTAELFRYNLRNLDKPVTLAEEIKNIDHYVHILKVRFSDRLDFVSEVDGTITDVRMPCMILQPIVENAFIHGISELENGGQIRLKVENRNGWVDVIIQDNGKGMTGQKIHEVLHGESPANREEKRPKGHTNGIGVYNILCRLRIFFNTEEVMEIHSEPDKGTEFVLHIPLERLA